MVSRDEAEYFDNLPVGEIISYEHFFYFLNQGREIEFVFNETEYFIGHHKQGRAVWKGEEQLSEYYNDQNEEFVRSAKIEGVTIAEIFKQKKARIISVF